ncbi:hypothetical protein P280DRAFT_515120 [Massarina eburnea CBS 473.64]|uniref:Uncharacterized protein n=1 Tax=Massarina eburnea CBS 473.64 TaxID=1395130 RepID=A0A6A6SA98_9PLEO|nr:hypothetical protein P280DRAFT_515120 [Massarina eburnea CBS 473.64]
MPTALDRTMTPRAPFFAFAAIITGAAAWSIWGNDIFPSQDPTGGTILLFFFIGAFLLPVVAYRFIHSSPPQSNLP